MKAQSEIDAMLQRLNQQSTERESRLRTQLMALPMDQLLTATLEMREQTNAKLREYGALAKKSFNPLPEITHNDSLSIEEQKTSLVEQYIKNFNTKGKAEVAISTSISKDTALDKYKAMKAQAAARRAPQSSSSPSSASGASEEHESSEKKTTGPS